MVVNIKTINYTFLVLFVLSIFSGQLVSQNDNDRIIDSLVSDIQSNSIHDSIRVKSYLKLAKIYLDINLDSTEHYAEKAKFISERIDFQKGLAVGIIRLAQVEERKGNDDKALELFNQSISLYDKENKDRDYLQAINAIGIIYEMRNDYDKSLEYYQIGLKEADLQNFIMGKAFFYNNISIIYSHTKNDKLALKYNIKASKLFKELGHIDFYSNSLVNIGVHYKNLGALDSAKYYYHQAEELQIEHHNFYGLSNLYGNLGNISMLEENMDDALFYFEKALSATKSMDYLNPEKKYKLAGTYIDLGKIHLLQQNYSKAKTNLFEGLEIAVRIKSKLLQKEGSRALFDYYMNLSQKDSATLYLDIFLTYNDSLLAEKYNDRIDKLNFEFQLHKERELSEKEMELVVLEKNWQEFIYLILVGILFLVVTIGIFIWYFQKLKLQKSYLVQQNLRLENENCLASLDKKNKELMTTVLNLLERNEFISKISERLQDMELQDKSDNSRNIDSIIKSIDKESINRLWKELEVRYMEVHNDFHEKLTSRFPNLTPNERRLCAFIVLDLSTKDISSITYQSPHSIKIARYRLRKKLNIEKNVSITSFLTNL